MVVPTFKTESKPTYFSGSEMKSINTTLRAKLEDGDVFYETAAAQGISGLFVALAIMITVHQACEFPTFITLCATRCILRFEFVFIYKTYNDICLHLHFEYLTPCFNNFNDRLVSYRGICTCVQILLYFVVVYSRENNKI
jgi:hypothetical protein